MQQEKTKENPQQLDFDSEVFGFKLLKKETIPGMAAVGWHLFHEQSGANVFYLQNDDNNRAFNLAFKTPSYDHTGVNHILEHSVLSGSKKYPLKAPFFNLARHSLNNYANATTSSAFTKYLFASTHKKDFQNLLEVYLDGVFRPLLLEDERIFRREGWRYELLAEQEELAYNGVVYNEMLGAVSDPKRVLYEGVKKTLFPESSFIYNSGGDPKAITQLTYEDFCAVYRKHYHPQNALFYLYGDLDLAFYLCYFQENYLKDYEKTGLQPDYGPTDKMKQPVEAIYPYSVNVGGTKEEKTFMTFNYVLQDMTKEETMGMIILNELLANYESSPLNKIVREEKLGSKFYGEVDVSLPEGVWSFVLEGSELKNKEKVKQLFEKILQQVAVEGFEEDFVLSALNKFELDYRIDKLNVNKGIDFSHDVIQGFFYHETPFYYLGFEALLENIRKKALKEGYLEKLLKEYLLQNPRFALVLATPEEGLSDQYQQEIKTELMAYQGSRSQEELADIRQKSLAFQEWLNTPDAPEDIAKLPSLKVEDIDLQNKDYPTQIFKEEQGPTFLAHAVDTGGISNLNFYFDARTLTKEEILLLPILSRLTGNLATENHTYEELERLMLVYSNGLASTKKIYGDYRTKDDIMLFWEFNISYLDQNQKQIKDLLQEVFLTQKFEDAGRIRQMIQEIKNQLEYNLLNNGPTVAISKLRSQCSRVGACQDLSTDVYYKYVVSLLQQDSAGFQQSLRKLEELYYRLISSQKLVYSLATSEKVIAASIESLKELVNSFPGQAKAPVQLPLPKEKRHVGYIVPTNVQFVVQGGNYHYLGYQRQGSIDVLKNILSEYLYEELREKGGAYGGYFLVYPNGDLVFLSYRDPHLKETLAVYQKSPAYLENFQDENNLEKHIIKAIGDKEEHYDVLEGGEVEDIRYLVHFDSAEKNRLRQEILATTLEDIQAYVPLLQKILAKDSWLVVGSEKKIKEEAEIFDQIINFLE